MTETTIDNNLQAKGNTQSSNDAKKQTPLQVLPLTQEVDGVDHKKESERTAQTDSASPQLSTRGSGSTQTAKGYDRDDRTSPICQKSEEEKELIRLALHRNPYFTCMDEEQVERFVQVAQVQTYRPGEAVILEGCRDERVYEYQPETADDALGPADVDDLLLDEDEPDCMTRDGDGDNSDRHATLSDANDTALYTLNHVPPPSSGSKSLLYIIKDGNADVLYHRNFNPASIGPGTLFGEGGFLFDRQHSASVVAAGPLECWVVGLDAFLKSVLRSENLRKIFAKHAHRKDSEGNLYMTMDDFIRSCLQDDQRETQNEENVSNGSSIEMHTTAY